MIMVASMDMCAQLEEQRKTNTSVSIWRDRWKR
jgi:hypothetical protein